MNTQTNTLYAISFCEKYRAKNGTDQLKSPVKVAHVIAAEDDTSAPLLNWDIAPINLKDGAYFSLAADPQDNEPKLSKNGKALPLAKITFAERQKDEFGTISLGREVEVAVIWSRKNGKRGGMVKWHLSPKSLKAGQFYFHTVSQ